MSRVEQDTAGRTPRSGALYEPRLARVARSLGDEGVSHLLVTNPKDVAYLTGFLGGDSYLLVGAGRPVVISDFRYEEELEPVRGFADVFIRRGPMPEATAEVIRSAGVEKVGIQAEHISVAQRNDLAGRIGAGAVRDTKGVVGRLRLIKDEHEVGLIREAVRVQERAMQAVLEWLRPGLTELEIASRLESEMKSLGSSEPGFPTIVAAGATGSLPHYRPGERRLEEGMPLLIDWGAVVGGYHSDMTRVFSIGAWDERIREIYGVVLEAHLAAAEALAPGKTTAEVDAVAREHIERAGHGDRFGHGLGHGMGLDGHEDPRLTHMQAATTIEAGMVVTIEPGIYLPGVGGVRIEDDYLVTAQGAQNLCTLPTDIDWATR